jgi:uncharacterized membrane protein
MSYTLSPLLPIWLVCLFGLAGLAACFLQFNTVRTRVGAKKGAAVSLLRLAVIWLILFFSLGPSMAKRTAHTTTPTVAVLIDTSLTMGLPNPTGKGSRLDEAKELLTGGSGGLLSALSAQYDVRLYALGDDLRSLSAADLATLKADSQSANLSGALETLAGRASVVFLVSDGAGVGRSSASPNGMPRDGGLPRGAPPKGDPPVVALPLAAHGTYRDVMISALRFPAVVFRERETTIEATVRSHGYENATVPVFLKEGDRLLAAKNIHLGASNTEVAVVFPFVASEVGTRRLSVTAQLQVGESVPENNTAEFSLKVARDKVRMLMVTGSPSPGYRFIRLALKNDPSVDLLSFVILRAPTNTIDVPLNEQSLIPFPVDTIFGKEMKDFDLVVFDNLLLHFYINQKHLEAVRELVRNGGGLAMIGGPSLSDEDRLGSGPLADLLPVTWDKPDYRRGRPSGLRLTSAGSRHPLTRLFPDQALDHRLWRELAPLDGVNMMKPAGSASVLLETEGAPSQPILVAGSYGKGRVLVLGTDYTWKWAAGLAAKGQDTSTYLRFVERMVRWLTHDPGLDPVTLELPEKPAQAGSPVQVKLTTGEDGKGRSEPPIFSVFGPDGVRMVSEIKQGAVPGEFFVEFVPTRKGAHRITVKSTSGMAEEALMVGTARDRLDGAPKEESLKAVAAETGGKMVSDGDNARTAVAVYAEKGRKSVVEMKEIPLWSTFYAIAALVTLLSAEWYLRRRWGLP